ncbi:MAG TPA: zf-HC2 domain-containing protein [Pyrinomonadaceae bacterium]
MKQEFDKQLDSLLRGTRGGAGEVRRAAAAEHLSPDELSAYAENALPQAARSLYTAHLADCSDCRRIVTTVVLASGAEVAREARPAGVADVSRAASKSSWGARLAALFSPRVMAYAAPVLAVAIIGAVALVILRGRQGSEAPNVAQRSDEEAARPGSITQPSPSAGTLEAAPAANIDAPAPQTQGSPAAAPGVGTAKTETTTNAPVKVKEMAQDKSNELADADEFKTASPVPKPEVAAAAAAPPPASSQPAEAVPVAPTSTGARAPAREADDREVSRQRRSAADNAREAERGEDARRDAPEPERGRAMNNNNERAERRVYDGKTKSDGNVPSETEGLASARKRQGGPATGGGRGAASETRFVAGHEFRRQGNAWVDVNYRSSMSTVSVRRGSDSFRSLAADIPEVGRAAGQLPGTVVIVARGRAYRIN